MLNFRIGASGIILAAGAAAIAIAAMPASAQQPQEIVILGAVKDQSHVQRGEDRTDRAMKTLPVAYEDRAPAKPAKSERPVSRPSGS